MQASFLGKSPLIILSLASYPCKIVSRVYRFFVEYSQTFSDFPSTEFNRATFEAF